VKSVLIMFLLLHSLSLSLSLSPIYVFKYFFLHFYSFLLYLSDIQFIFSPLSLGCFLEGEELFRDFVGSNF